MIMKYIILFTTLFLLIFGNTFTNLFPIALCEDIDSLQSSQSPQNEEKNNIYFGMLLFGIAVVTYIIYIKSGSGGTPPSTDSLLPTLNTDLSAPVVEPVNKVVLQREVVASVNIPPRSTFTNQYTLDLGQKVYQQTKEIAALNTQIASLQDTIYGLENKVYISQAQLETARSTISKLQQEINFSIDQNKLFGQKTQLIVNYLYSLYDIHPDVLSREALNKYLIENGLF